MFDDVQLIISFKHLLTKFILHSGTFYFADSGIRISPSCYISVPIQSFQFYVDHYIYNESYCEFWISCNSNSGFIKYIPLRVTGVAYRMLASKPLSTNKYILVYNQWSALHVC